MKNAMNQDTKSNSIDRILFQDEVITGPTNLAEAFNEHFASIGERLAKTVGHTDINPTQFLKQAKTKFKFKQIKVEEVFRVINNKTNDLILNLTPENVTQHSRIVATTRKGSSTPTKMSKIIGRQIH